MPRVNEKLKSYFCSTVQATRWLNMMFMKKDSYFKSHISEAGNDSLLESRQAFNFDPPISLCDLLIFKKFVQSSGLFFAPLYLTTELYNVDISCSLIAVAVFNMRDENRTIPFFSHGRRQCAWVAAVSWSGDFKHVLCEEDASAFT